MYPQSTVDIARQLSDLGILDRENALICGCVHMVYPALAAP
jgi:hypothetical protein